MPNYLYVCGKCGHQMDVFYRLTEHRPEYQKCTDCGEEAEYQIQAPMVLRASFLDGHRRKDFKDLKEASKLNLESVRTQDPETRKEIEKEIRKTGFDIRKDGLT